jgi:hypothetical protein
MSKRRINYETKLQANEDAIQRWTSKLKYAATKLGKLSAKRRRLLVAQAEQNQVSTGSPFARKFS